MNSDRVRETTRATTNKTNKKKYVNAWTFTKHKKKHDSPLCEEERTEKSHEHTEGHILTDTIHIDTRHTHTQKEGGQLSVQFD